jgi:hypothetical protein
MDPNTAGALADGAIPFLGGLWATLMGLRVVGKRPGADPAYDDWHARYGQKCKVLGPLLMLFAVFTFFIQLNQAPSAPASFSGGWTRCTSSDGVCSAEFPREPTHERKTLGGVEFDTLSLAGSVDLRFTFSDVPLGAPPATDEERLDAVRDATAASSPNGMRYVFVREQSVVEGGVKGRELEFTAGNEWTVLARWFVRGRRLYRAIATVPRAERRSEVAARFVQSVRFEDGKH